MPTDESVGILSSNLDTTPDSFEDHTGVLKPFFAPIHENEFIILRQAERGRWCSWNASTDLGLRHALSEHHDASQAPNRGQSLPLQADY